MNSPICTLLGIDFPLIAFSHCRDVVVEVSKAGGMGVLGVAGISAEQLEIELRWIDAHIDGKPYGVDLIVPERYVGKGEAAIDPAVAIPAAHRQFVREVLTQHGIDSSDITDEAFAQRSQFGANMRDGGALQQLEVAFSHSIRLIANALGVPPDYMLERAKRAGVPVSIFSSSPGAKPAGTVVMCQPWCWCLKCMPRSNRIATCRSSPPVASSPVAKWRRAWRWARQARGPRRCG